MSVLSCDLSFDPADPYHPLPGAPGVRWALQVFTAGNGYGLAPGGSAESNGSGGVFGYARLGQQALVAGGRVTVRIVRDGDAWEFYVAAEHDEPIKSVKLVLRGLPAHHLADGWWSPTTPRDEVVRPPFQWNYPSSEWVTRWAAAGGTSIGIRSDRVSAAVLHVGTPAYGTEAEVELVHAVPAGQWATRVTVPPIRLAIGGGPSSALAELGAHHAAMRAGFGIPSWEERRDVPDWARGLDLVVTMHGQHWTGHVFHTFDEMRGLLTRVADHVDPARVLVYLPGWEGRYYYDYPDYRPGADLGGDAGFARLVTAAHEAGFHLMPMFGANGANVVRYPGWEAAALRNPSDRYPVMLNAPDWDGDRFPEGDQVFLNPGEPGYQRHLVDAVSSVVDRFGVDAAFFDTAAFWFDDPRYPVYEGYRAIVAKLHERHPELLLVAEGWWDAMTALFPMSQQWLGVPRDVRAPELLTDSARTTAHLAEGTPGLGSTGVHEQGFRGYRPGPPLHGHLPVLGFAGGDGREQLAELPRILASLGQVTGITE